MRLLLISIIGGVTIASSASTPQGRVAPEPGVAHSAEARWKVRNAFGDISSSMTTSMHYSNIVVFT
jgi:hypothetical protein